MGKKTNKKTPQKNKGGSFIEIMLSTSYTAKSSYVYMQNQNKKKTKKNKPPNYYLKKKRNITSFFCYVFAHFHTFCLKKKGRQMFNPTESLFIKSL